MVSSGRMKTLEKSPFPALEIEDRLMAKSSSVQVIGARDFLGVMAIKGVQEQCSDQGISWDQSAPGGEFCTGMSDSQGRVAAQPLGAD